ncbi:MAG: hypothetical protein ABR587_13910 [Candidatus Binatia bacterium]
MTATMAPGRPLLLDRYDENDLLAMFAEAGVLEAIEKRGFGDPAIDIDASSGPLIHTRLFAAKNGRRFLLLDTCLTELRLDARDVARYGTTGAGSFDLVVVYWLREQDPTATFDPRHERLPLQEHPGLGVLRRAFRVALRISKDLGKHGIAALPKYFHDAAIFYRSRLFLFLDPREQGRFEALLRDLTALSLGDASLALLGNAVRDRCGVTAAWQPGLQVMPLSPELTACFHSTEYQTECREEFEGSSFGVDPAALAAAREVFEQSLARGPAVEE